MSADAKKDREPGNRYEKIIAAVFHQNHKPGSKRVCFVREDLTRAAEKLGIKPASGRRCRLPFVRRRQRARNGSSALMARGGIVSASCGRQVLPVQAKRGADWLSIVQIEQDFAVCAAKFPSLVCKPIAAQFMDDAVIALFDFENTKDGVRVCSEKHYRLVPPQDMTDADLASYRKSLN